ncbi:MAG: c-type cytochrome [Myxococcota bacterium]
MSLILVVFLVGCDMPTPQSPAEPIGEYPSWGKGFGEEATQPASAGSLLAGGGMAAGNAEDQEGEVPRDTPNAAVSSGGGGSTTPNQPSPFANEDWSGGDIETGRRVFVNQCARCHGVEGKGGMVAGIGMVPTLRDPSWHDRMSDKALASTIAHGKGAMPSFMQLVDGKELRGVIAYVRTLKRSAD